MEKEEFEAHLEYLLNDANLEERSINRLFDRLTWSNIPNYIKEWAEFIQDLYKTKCMDLCITVSLLSQFCEGIRVADLKNLLDIIKNMSHFEMVHNLNFTMHTLLFECCKLAERFSKPGASGIISSEFKNVLLMRNLLVLNAKLTKYGQRGQENKLKMNEIENRLGQLTKNEEGRRLFSAFMACQCCQVIRSL